MVVTFNVKRVPVFRFITIPSRDFVSFKNIVRRTKIPCRLLKVETGFNRRADFEFVRTPNFALTNLMIVASPQMVDGVRSLSFYF
jgi:hypothetical protein